MSSSKILSLDVLGKQAEKAKSLGKSIVLCHGSFDLMHAGHIKHLQRACKEGDILFVTITADEYVNKGPGRPVFNEQLRAETLASLSCVDGVAIVCEDTALSVIDFVRPDVYVKGGDYKHVEDDISGNIEREVSEVEKHGGRVFFTDEVSFSSSSLLNEHFDVFSKKTKSYLELLRSKYTHSQIFDEVFRLRNKKILVVGEAIMDEYHFTTSLGKTGKGNMLAVKYESKEQFAGGALAVANHIASFIDDTFLLTELGLRNTYEKFIREKLNENIKPKFFYRNDSETLVKRRFVDADMTKLFEVYYYNDCPVASETDRAICHWMHENVSSYDAVIVSDFGNGFITSEMRRILSEKAQFLAVNTQLNSGNHGYHVITHYSRADYVALNEPELRLATHDRNSDLAVLAKQVAKQLEARFIAVTLGMQGLMLLDVHEEMLTKVPALSTKVVDRVGAGDAFLAISGLCLSGKVNAELSAFLGSVAAALEVQSVCNRDPVNSVSLFKYVTTLLK